MMRVLTLVALFVGIQNALAFDNLDYGAPVGGDSNTLFVIDREGYAVGFDIRHRQPRWVSYRLTASEVMAGRMRGRSDDFREDPFLPVGFLTLRDYWRSGFDRGHLAPAADMGWSERAMSESFYLSNMSPQRPQFNRGVWKDLESWVRRVAIREGSVVVVSGCLFDGATEAIGPNRVTVPVAYFKTVLSERVPMKAIGFVIPNAGTRIPFYRFAYSVDGVERLTGLDLYPLVEASVQTNVEKTASLSDWTSFRPGLGDSLSAFFSLAW